MKKLLSIFVFTLLTTLLTAQGSKTINISTPGTLTTLLTEFEKANVVDLKITGSIDARDIKCLRDEVTDVAILDLSLVNIVEYSGDGGTSQYNTSYPANELPENSFYINVNMGKYFLTSIILPNSITSIGNYAFSNCVSLLGCISIPSSVENIGLSAFAGCGGIKTINCLNPTPPIIPQSYYGYDTFQGVTATIIVPNVDVVATYKNANGWSGFSNIIARKKVIINNVSAGSLAASIIIGGFGTLSTITELTVTGNINSADISQIKTNMTNIAELDISAATITNNTLPANALKDKLTLTTVKLPTTLETIGDYAFSGCTSLVGQINIPPNVITIGNYAYTGCRNLSGEINLPNNLITIGNYAFKDCKGFSGNLIIPNKITVIGDNSFDGCTGIGGSLIIGNSVTTIGDMAFQIAFRITGNLDIPNSVTRIGSGAFWACSGFTGNLTIPNSISSLGAGAFTSCSGFDGTLTISTSLTTLGLSTFTNCSKLTGHLNIPNSVTSLGDNVFYGCSSFNGDLFLPNSITSIGKNAFNGCSGFSGSLTLPTTLTTINASTFEGCSNISGNLNLPQSITTISTNAFKGCVKITDIEFSKNIISISDNAFYDCSSMSKISVNNSIPPKIFLNTFGGLFNVMCQLEVPIDALETYQSTDFWSNFIFISEKSFTTNNHNLDFKNTNQKIYSSNSDIIIEGTSKGEIIKLYSLNGTLLSVVISNGKFVSIPVRINTVYVLKSSTMTKKVVM